ncbi:MAG: cadherin domain-containing protein [Verrucomicrobiales bacterium]|nr:cadherin domain-containing protein [Verrucomicrobiales bacterium]
MSKKTFFEKFLSRNKSESKKGGKENREYVAEQLESRILYSAAPVDIAPAGEVVQEPVDQSTEGEFQGIDNFGGTSQFIEAGPDAITGELVTLTSFDHLSESELETLANAAVERWKATDLSTEQLEALDAIEISVVDIEGLAIAETNGYEIELDWNANGAGWFVDESPFDDGEFDFAESSTVFRDTDGEAKYGMDLLTVMMHEMGHVLGLEDIYDSFQDDSLMYGGFEAGERRLPVEDQADGVAVGTQVDAHASVIVTNLADDGTASGTGITLREAINQVADGETITLGAGMFELDSSTLGDINISDRTFTIIGDAGGGTIITAPSSDRIFNITGTANITLEGLTLSGGEIHEGDGGAVRVSGANAQLTLTDITFEDNEVIDDVNNNTNARGGALYAQNSAVVTGTNVDFTNNKAIRSGGAEVAGGGAFYVNTFATVTITGGTMSNNEARDGGGFYANASGVATLNNYTVSTNTGTVNGGGFNVNTGGIVNGDNLTIDQNFSANNGGGFYTNTLSDQVTLVDSVISGNTAEDDHGGGFFNRGIVSLDNTEVKSNVNLEVDGGANRRDALGAGFFNEGGTVTLANGSDVTLNQNYGHGGGFANATGGTVIVENSTISQNSLIRVSDARGGAGFYNYGGGTVELKGATIEDNTVTINASGNLDGYGGGFYNYSLGTVTADASTVIQNNHANEGTGFRNSGYSAVVTLTGTSVINNEARTRGGAFSIRDGAVTNLDGATVTGNSTLNENGGAGYMSGGILNVTNGTKVENNFTTNNSDYGGAFYITGNATASFQDSFVNNNKATLADGGAFFIVSSQVTLTNTEVKNNFSENSGGGIFLDDSADLTVVGSDISDNIAQDNGGALYVRDDATLSVSTTHIDGNLAGYLADGSTPDGTGLRGGAIYATNRSVITINESTLDQNEATQHGGAIYLQSEADITINQSTIAENVARGVGGGFHVNGSTTSLVINNSTISTNYAGFERASQGGIVGTSETKTNDNQRGGAIYQGSGFVHINQSTVTNNRASDSASGALWSANRTSETEGFFVENSIIYGNLDNFEANPAGDVQDIQRRVTIIGSNVVGSSQGTGDNGTGTKFSDDPQLEALADNGGFGRTHTIAGTNFATSGATVNPTVNSSHAVDQLGNGRGDTIGAVEVEPVATTLTLDEVIVPASAEDDTKITVSATGTSTGAGPLVYNWSVTDSADNTVASGSGESFSFTPDELTATDVSDILTVALTVTDSATSQVVIAQDQDILLINPDGRPTAASGATEITVNSFVEDGQVIETTADTDGTVTLREAINIANNTAGDVVINLSAGTYTSDLALGDVRINYDTESSGGGSSINVGDVIVGETRGATGTVVSVTDNGSSGFIIYTPVSGTFADNEYIKIQSSDTRVVRANGDPLGENANANGGDFDITKTDGTVVIVGDSRGTTIVDGNGVDRVFDARPGSTVVFKQLTITGGQTYEDHGAGISSSGGTVVLNDVEISGNSATGHGGHVGGAVYITSSGNFAGNLYAKNVEISNNEAGSHGGGLFLTGTNSASGAFKLEDVTISGNTSGVDTSDRDGGGLYLAGNRNNLEMTNVTFDGNRARDDGGGAVFEGYDNVVSATNVNFYGNIAGTEGTGTGDNDGGGFLVSGARNEITFTDSNIGGELVGGAGDDGLGTDRTTDAVGSLTARGNFAEDDGGGFRMEGKDNILNLVDTDIIGNQSNDDGGGFSAINNQETINIFGTSVIRNNFSATQYGGGFRIDGALVNLIGTAAVPLVISHNEARGNDNDRRGGGFYSNGGTVIGSNVSIKHNVAERHGGGFWNDGGVVTITSSDAATFMSNISYNTTVDPADGDGGGFYNTNGGTINLTDVDIEGNTTTDEGAGFYNSATGATVNLTRVNLTNNISQDSGGGFYNAHDGSIVNFTDVVIDSNVSETEHGAGFRNNGIVTGSRVLITNNETKGTSTNNRIGAAFYNAGNEATVTLSEVVMANNTAHGRGGAVYNTDGDVDLTNFVIRDNVSYNTSGSGSNSRGGGVWNSDRGSVTLTNGEISGNNANRFGGGIYQQTDGSELVLNNVTISGNKAGAASDGSTPGVGTEAIAADADGGGIFMTNAGSVILNHVTIADNYALDDGGGIDRDGGTLIIRDSILANNIRDNGVPGTNIESDNNATATLEGGVVIVTNQGGTLTQTDGTRITEDPVLGALGDNGDIVDLPGGFVIQTHAVAPGSSAVGAENSAAGGAVTTDARGADRNGVRTLGAYQLSAPVFDGNPTVDTNSITAGDTVTVSGDILYDLLPGETGNDVVVTISWGDGSPVTRTSLSGATDFAAASPDFSGLSHDYGAAGSFTLSVSLTLLGSDEALDEYTEVITVAAPATPTQEVTTTENSTVTITPTSTDVVSTGTLTVDDGTILVDGNRIGYAVDISSGTTGTWAVVGSEGQANTEEVYIYRDTTGNGDWVLEQTLLSPDNVDAFDDFGSSINIDAENGRIFVGARLEDTGGTDKGTVFLYTFDSGAVVGSQWSLEQRIQGTTGANGGDDFGYSLDASGDYLVVGARLEDSDTIDQSDTGGANDSGAVYVFKWDGAAYVQEQKLKAQLRDGSADVQGADQFGVSVAINEAANLIVVGQELEDTVSAGNNGGAAYVYSFDDGQAVGSQWSIERKLVASNAGDEDRFGHDVDISGTTVIIGARQEDTGTGANDNSGTNRGSIYVYDFSGSAVGAVITPSTANAIDNGRIRFTTDNVTDPLSIAFVDGGAEGIAFAGGIITVTLNTGTSTAASIAALVNGTDLGALGVTNGGTLNATELSHGTGTELVEAAGPVELTAGFERQVINAHSGVTHLSNEDRLGGAVAIDGDRIIAGAYQDDINGSNSGTAHIFDFDSGSGLFTHSTFINQENTASADRNEFGFGVAMDGDRYIIGARLSEGTFTSADGAVINIEHWGSAHIYSGDPSVAVAEEAALQGGLANKSEIGSRALFGRRVSVGGDFAIVGAPEAGKDPNGTDDVTGRVYLYKRNDQGTINPDDDSWTLITDFGPPITDDDAFDYFGWGVTISEDGSTIAVGANGHEAGGSAQGAIYIYSFDGTTATLAGRIRAENRTNSDQFGRDLELSADGSVLVTGMLSDDDIDSGSGSAHIYTATAGWSDFFSGAATQQGVLSINDDGVKLKPISEYSDVNSDQFGRYVAISSDGTRIAVGAYDDDHVAGGTDTDPDDDGNATQRDRGSVYVFQYDAANLHAVIDPDIVGGENGKGQIAVHATVASGISAVEIVTGATLGVTESGGTVTITLAAAGSTAADIVAAIGSAGIAGFSGELFPGNGAANQGGNDGSALLTLAHGPQALTNWEMQQKLVASNDGKDDRFGADVDIDGDYLVVGANQEDNPSNSGSAYIFEFDGSQWSEVQKINASDQQSNDHFGRRVAIDNDLIVVGAYLEDTSGTSAGSVYVYQRDPDTGVWGDGSDNENFVIRSPYGQSQDGFGLAVDVSEGNIVVGANQQDRILSDGTVISNYGGAHGYRVEEAAEVDQITVAPAKGTATVAADNLSISFDPGSDFDDLDPGDTEEVTFTYTTVGGDTIDVVVVVNGVNDIPVGVDDDLNANEDDGATVIGNVTTNDTDDDADASLTVAEVNGDAANVGNTINLASGATVAIASNGDVTFDANSYYESLADGETAEETVTYQVTDGNGNTVYQEVDGVFVAEAVNFGSSPDSWTQIEESDGGANANSLTGSRTGFFMQVPDGSGGISTPSFADPTGSPAITYEVEVSTAGTYQLFLRGASFDGASDSVFATINGHGDGIAGGNPDWYAMAITGSAFNWHGQGNLEDGVAGTSAAVTFDLSAGRHTIHISAREDGVALDAVMLRNTTSTVAAPAQNSTEAGPDDQREATVTVTVAGENDQVFANAEVNQTHNYNEGSTAFTLNPIVVADVDNNEQITATLTMSNALAGTLSTSGAATFNAGVWEITGTVGEVNAAFAALSFTPDSDFDQNSTISVDIEDGLENSTVAVTGTINLNVTAVDDPPTIVSADTANFAENGTGTVIDVQSTDPEGATEGAGLTYSLSGGADQALFNIDANTGELTFAAAPDFENPADAGTDNTYNVQVQVSDGANDVTQDITVTVTNVNEAPTINSANTANFAENGTGTVIDVQSSDPEGAAEGAGLIYSISGGADQALFNIDANTGELTFASAPDFETQQDAGSDNVYNVQVQVTDGTNPVTQDIAVTVTDVDAVLSIANAAPANEGNSGTTPFTFTVTRSGDTSGPASASYTVSGDGANPADANDFGGSFPTGSVSFADGETSRNIIINVSGDTDVEPSEGFKVTLSAPVDAVLGTAEATGTITNDEVINTVYVDQSLAGTANNDPVADADGGSAGAQNGVFGIDVFATIGEALSVVSASGGTVIVNSGSYSEVGGVEIPSGVTMEITGPDASGAVEIAELSSEAGGNIVIEGGSTLTVANNSPQTIAGPISGSGSLAKTGNGNLTLDGVNTYSGTTSIDDGMLTVDGRIGQGGPAGDVSIANGATLSGGGTVYADISGAAGSTIEASGDLTIGDSASSSGVSTAGELIVGPHTVILNDSTVAVLGVSTELNGGTLNAGNGISHSSGETLSGSGTINGDVSMNSATISPGGSGDNTGTLTINGAFSSAGAINLEIDGITAGSFDQIVVNGGVDIDNATITPSGSSAETGTVVLIENTSANPTSANNVTPAEGSTVDINGQTFVISYSGGDGNDITADVPAADDPFVGNTTGYDFLENHSLFSGSESLFLVIQSPVSEDLSVKLDLTPYEGDVVPIELNALDLTTDLVYNLILSWENESGDILDDIVYAVDGSDLVEFVRNLRDTISMVVSKM